MQEIVYHTNFELENNYFWFVSRAKILLKILKTRTNLNNESNVIDIGCGTGGFASELDKLYNVTCLDTEPIALEYCKKRGLTDLHQGILEDFDPNGKKFDSAFMLDVIEHIEDDKEVVSQVYDLLEEGSYFLATVPAYQWMWSHHDVMHMHYRRYTKPNFEKLLKDAGFNIEYSSYYNTFLFPAVLLKRAIDKLTGAKKEDPVEEVPEILNKLFEKIFSFESKFLPGMSFPFGLSIVVLAKK